MKFYNEHYFNRRNWILENIGSLNINCCEALVLLEIDYLNECNKAVSLDSLSKACNMNKLDIDETINSLISKGYLTMNTKDKIEFCIDSIFEAKKDIVESNDLYSLFENEFRRVLSQKEITTIAEWSRMYSNDAIIAALKEAVINRMMTNREISFNYIGKILSNGDKQ